MSTESPASRAKIILSTAHAVRAAERMRTQFPIESFSRWTFAGSLRRGEQSHIEVVHAVKPILERAAFSDPARRGAPAPSCRRGDFEAGLRRARPLPLARALPGGDMGRRAAPFPRRQPA